MCEFSTIYKKEGYVCLYENETRLMDELDADFVHFLDGYVYSKYTIPAMLDLDVLKRCNYLESFPHHLSIVSTIKEDRLGAVSQSKDFTLEDVSITKKVLTPAACLHIYPMLEGQEITQKIITTKARVYRYEGNRYDEVGRLWDYTVREIVFVGSHEYVRDMLAKMQEQVLAYGQTITKNAKLIPSSDVFYENRRNTVKKKLQVANDKKFELIIPIDGKDVAVASFNFHGNHFSMPFHFDNKNTIVTGCVGFGLERWLLAKLFYKGGK